MSEAEKEVRVVWGARAIGGEIGLTERQAFWMLENALLPARKVGDRWCADVGKLHAYIRGEGIAA